VNAKTLAEINAMGVTKMHYLFKNLIKNMRFSSDLKNDIYLFLTQNGFLATAQHCMDVGDEARRVALLFNVDPLEAEIAGWLHDISAVFPNQERIFVAREVGIDVLPEEEVFPMIIHQKLSRVMAKEIFKIDNSGILDAVECHTTLKAASTMLDKVLFVADKIAWDQSGKPPYIEDLDKSLKISLEHGAYSYISFLWDRR
jgi:predicted HD superfamily hydrolase involved in NAD metabolism